MKIVDADGHLCEPPRLWEDNLPASMREHGIRLRWNEATGYDECWVEDGMATDRGLVGLGNAGESFADFGRGRHYEDLNPAGFDAGERVKVLDAEGIDVSVMYPGLGLKLGAIHDRDLAVASCEVYNDWLADWCAQAPDRLIGVGALPMQDPQRAADEVHRIAAMDLKAGFARPNAYNDRHLHHPSYTPVWEALSETGLPIAFHPAGLSDMPGASRALGALMAPGNAPRAHLVDRPADHAVEPCLRRRARTVPGVEGDRARVRRRLDRALDGPPRRVPRELRLGNAARSR